MMPLDFEIERPSEDETVLVLPYVRNFEDGRSNHGFRDTRGRPELIDAIVEAGTSPALKELLRALPHVVPPQMTVDDQRRRSNGRRRACITHGHPAEMMEALVVGLPTTSNSHAPGGTAVR